MPLGLLSIAATLLEQNRPVEIYRPRISLLKNEDYEDVAKDILSMQPLIIGFSTWCITYPASLIIAEEIKKKNSEIPLIFGGPQASILSYQTLKIFPFVDYVLIGEADVNFPLFLNELEKSCPDFTSVPGLTFRKFNGSIVQNKQNGAIQDLDTLPVPAYHLIPNSKAIKLDVGRGCPFHCTYCSTNNFFSKTYRVKSVQRIVKEILDLNNRLKITSFSFAHDMFTLDKKFIFALCKKLISIQKEKGLLIKWTCSARIDCVNDEMLHEMQKAGCRAIFFGIESGSQKIQKSIRKNLNLGQAFHLATICRILGIKMHVSFIIGFPEETETDLEETLQCITKLSLQGTFVQISQLSVLPGTSLYNQNLNQLKFDGCFSNFSNAFCGPQELKLINQYPEIFSSFYHLPISVFNHDELTLLCRVVNKQAHFRNTLYLMAENIQKEIQKKNLTESFKNFFDKDKKTKNDIPLASHWINILEGYISKNRYKIKSPHISAIFAIEAIEALLSSIYSVVNFVFTKEHVRPCKYTPDSIILPSQKWTIIETKYLIEKILPSENGWEITPRKIKKGQYKYLIAAIADNECIRKRIDKKDVILLNRLSKIPLIEYVKMVQKIQPKDKTVLWLKRMNRLGVLEFVQA